MISRQHPGIDEHARRRLWEHTSGNPLHLAALLNEYDVAALCQQAHLPAPAQLAAITARQLERLPEATRRLLHAIAVLGSGSIPLAEAAELAQVGDASTTAQAALDAGMLQLSSLDQRTLVRLPHALVRAAVYQKIPLPERQQLHLQAADLLSGQAAVLEHRMAAADRYDDDLADALECYGDELHAQRWHRLAGRYKQWASDLTAEPKVRERRMLDALFETCLARDFAAVHRAVPSIAAARSADRAALVMGALAVVERRLPEAIDLLEPFSGYPTLVSDHLTAYRVEALLAWSRLGSGQPTQAVADGIDRLDKLDASDPALSGFVVFCRGQVAVRLHGAEAVLAQLRDLPAAAAVVPRSATFQLAWRGALHARRGMLPEAIEDLSEFAHRMQAGAPDFGAGSLHAFLAHAQWLRGDWGDAQLNFGLARDIAGAYPHQLTVAMAPVVAIGQGDFEKADDLIHHAVSQLRETPWQDGCELLLITRVIRLHAQATPQERSGLLGSLRGSVFDSPDPRGKSSLLLMHVALAAIWAGDLSRAEQCLHEMSCAPLPPSWLPAIREWLCGLVAEAQGRGVPALRHLQAAIDDDRNDLPLYRSHLLADHARVALILGHVREADASLTRAEAGYRSLGARPYVERLASLRARNTTPTPAAPRLTDRERDVLTLVLRGLSYAQIAGELFITKKTVGYHLSNVYAKTGLTSRHELADTVRRQPTKFGLSAVVI